MSDLITDVRRLLREGFGIEDIAQQLDMDVDAVRRLVRRWQETGVIKSILGNVKGDARKGSRTD